LSLSETDEVFLSKKNQYYSSNLSMRLTFTDYYHPVVGS